MFGNILFIKLTYSSKHDPVMLARSSRRPTCTRIVFKRDQFSCVQCTSWPPDRENSPNLSESSYLEPMRWHYIYFLLLSMSILVPVWKVAGLGLWTYFFLVSQMKIKSCKVNYFASILIYSSAQVWTVFAVIFTESQKQINYGFYRKT